MVPVWAFPSSLARVDSSTGFPDSRCEILSSCHIDFCYLLSPWTVVESRTYKNVIIVVSTVAIHRRCDNQEKHRKSLHRTTSSPYICFSSRAAALCEVQQSCVDYVVSVTSMLTRVVPCAADDNRGKYGSKFRNVATEYHISVRSHFYQ